MALGGGGEGIFNEFDDGFFREVFDGPFFGAARGRKVLILEFNLGVIC